MDPTRRRGRKRRTGVKCRDVDVWRCAGVIPAVAVLGAAIAGTPTAAADNKRLNDGVVANVYTVQHQAGCENDVTISPHCSWPPSGIRTTC